MARLPQAADLQRRPVPAATPGINVRGVDFGPQAAGARAIAEGLGSVAKAGQSWGAKLEAEQNDVDDFETKRRLLDFTDAAERALEDHKRQMPVGGQGYSETWAEKYRSMAGEFVGKDDSNIPRDQRGRIGLQLKQFERQLSERAWRDEYGERDRQTITGLETTVTGQRSRVEADPSRHDEVQAEVGRLIDLAPITPAQRDVYKRKVRSDIQEAAGYAWAERATTAEGREAARRILAPHAADKGAASGPLGADYMEEIKKSEGFTPRASWDYKQHSVGYGTKARFPGEQIDKAEAERRFAEEIAKAGEIVDKFKPGLPAGTRAALVSLTFNAGSSWTQSGLGQAIQSGDMATAKQRFMQYNQAGGEVLPGLASRRQKEASWFGKGDAGQEGTASYMDAGLEEYSGPLADLPLAKRRAIWAKAEARFAQEAKTVQDLIKDQMTASERGVLPPEPWLAAVEPRVKALGDPTTAAMYETMRGKAAVTAAVRAMPPAVQAIEAQRLRADLTANGGTAEHVQYVEHREKLAAEAESQIKNDALTWAQRNKPTIPLVPNANPEGMRLIAQGRGDEAEMLYPGEYGKPDVKPLHFGAQDVAKQLDERFSTAQAVSRFTGSSLQVFTPQDKELLGNALKQGGEPLLIMAGHIAAAAERSGVDASMVLKDLAPRDAPELAMVGHLVGARADQTTLKTAAAALKWKIGQGEKFISTIDKTQSQPSLGEYEKVFKTAPTARDSLKSLASLVYEYESRQKGITTFDQTLYTDVVHRLMGQTTDTNGNTYGGVGWQKTGWFDGVRTSQVLVPPQVKQDSFDSLVSTLRSDDIIKAAGGMATNAEGQPYSISELRGMTFESIGPPGAPPVAGVYLVKVRDGANGAAIYARNGGVAGRGSARAGQEMGELPPLVVDLRPILGDLRKRNPEIFQGHRPGLEFAVPTPDPAYGMGYDIKQTPRPPRPSDRTRAHTTIEGIQ